MANGSEVVLHFRPSLLRIMIFVGTVVAVNYWAITTRAWLACIGFNLFSFCLHCGMYWWYFVPESQRAEKQLKDVLGAQ
jgi:low temperature requirement protein LtrA